MASVDPCAERPDDSSSRSALLRLLASIPGPPDALVAIVNGLFGDALEERDRAAPMTIRSGGTVLPTDRAGLRELPVELGPRLCILVHGLMSTESIWRHAGDAATNYGTVLARDHDLTVLSVRYNTGRHISTNGRELARLIDRLVAAWPVRVREIDLIGHSMGGLVVRSACHYGRVQRATGRRLPIGRPWTTKVRRIVLIGVPNTGAGLEAVVNSISAALWSLPIPATRLVGLGLDQRSAGIRDLRFGAIVDEDWLEIDPDARERPFDHRPDRLRRARHLVIAGSVTADPEHPMARLIGDALVTPASATGRSPDGELFRRVTTHTFPGIPHNALAHHPDVFRAISEWW